MISLRVRDVVERVVDLAAQRFGPDDDRDGDQGCDEAVLDGGGTAFISKETADCVFHEILPRSCSGIL